MDQRIEARIAALESEISSLKALLTQDDDAATPTSDRRGMVKLLAASAVGAVTGAALLNAQPAAAADGEMVLVGGSFESDSPTSFNAINGSALVVNSQILYGIEADGGSANALFNATGESPLGTPGTVGALFVDGVGDWWAATATDPFVAVWRKLAGPGSAGQLHLLDAPVRVYDSRPGQDPVAVEPKAPTTPNEARTIDTTLGGTAVPATANAVVINLTINAPQGPGFATVWPAGPWPGTSNINFATGQDIAATAIVGCDVGGRIQVLSNTVTNVIIDVSGYYQ
jgi:hypothetical protein